MSDTYTAGSPTVDVPTAAAANDYSRALEICSKLAANGISATVDPRAATPPCVLGTPASGREDLACGYTAEWSWYALVPGTANADAWKALVELRDQVRAVVPVERWDFTAYSLSADTQPVPAYLIRFEEAIS